MVFSCFSARLESFRLSRQVFLIPVSFFTVFIVFLYLKLFVFVIVALHVFFFFYRSKIILKASTPLLYIPTP